MIVEHDIGNADFQHRLTKLVKTFPAAITAPIALALIDDALAFNMTLDTSTYGAIGNETNAGSHRRSHAKLVELRGLWARKKTGGDRFAYTAKNRERGELLAALKKFYVDASPWVPGGPIAVVFKEARSDLGTHLTQPWTNPDSPFRALGDVPPWVWYAGAAVVALHVLRPYAQPVLRRLER